MKYADFIVKLTAERKQYHLEQKLKKKKPVPIKLTPEEKERQYIGSVKDRILNNIVIDCFTRCWEWKGSKKQGYGKMSFKKKNMGAHRVSYLLFKGSIPDGLYVCHSCDVPHCVNPDHLFLGTAKDNMQDCARKGRLKSNPERSISLEKAANIKKCISEKDTHKMTMWQIAEKFSVPESLVKDIRYNRSYIHVQAAV